MASRDGAKTISGSILNVLLITHFKAEIAHLAAVRKQAEKAIEYTNTFIRKVKPYLESAGRKIVSDSKSKIQILNEDNSISYIDVIIANLAGGNSQRATVGSYDELDTLSKQGFVGYKEAKLIPTRKNFHGPMTVKYSTRKFSFGIFEKEIENRETTKEKLVQWNILDITEKCRDERSLKSTGNIHERFVKKELPMKLYTAEDVEKDLETNKGDYKKIQLFDGCLKCPLAAVCQGKLSERPDRDKEGPGVLLKSIDFTIGQFRSTDPDMAEAQLLCWKPTTEGLVYPKFSSSEGDNVVTIAQAYELVTGEEKPDATFDELVLAIRSLDIKVYAGVDFGFTNHSVIVILALLANGISLILDTYSKPGLESHEFAEIAEGYQEKYGVYKWFCDQAAPATIKTFKKKGLRCPEFKKDVQDGINSIRSQIITTMGHRLLKVVKTQENENILTMFKEHHFLLDVAGNVSKNPDDEAGTADIADATRYLGQNLFSTKVGFKPIIATQEEPGHAVRVAAALSPDTHQVANTVNTELMKQEIANRATDTEIKQGGDKITKKKIFWGST